MTIDEAILLERETVRRNKMMLELDKLMQESHAVCFDKLKREKCIRIHEQLAEWLEELKAYKKNSNTCPMCDTYCSYLAEEFENGYNKAIDDFIKACDKKCGFYSGINKQLTRDMLLEIAEQLKEGVENEN